LPTRGVVPALDGFGIHVETPSIQSRIALFEEDAMHAVYTEVNIPNGVSTDGAADGLKTTAVPAVRAAGAVSAYWLEPLNGRALGVVLFDDEAAARAAAAGLHVGDRPGNAPDGVTFRTVEVREVIASL
jgi:hypothetical protein